MTNHEVLRLLQQKIEEGLALAANPSSDADEAPADEATAARILEWPTIPDLAGLESGFTAEEEARARTSAKCQELVRLYWRIRPVALWMLARYLVEGDAFPFARALRRHLQDDVRPADASLLKSALAAALARSLAREQPWTSPWTSMLERVRTWEMHSVRFALPALRLSFASDEPKLFGARQELPDGAVVTLEEVRRSQLIVSVTRPVDAPGTDALYVTLTGDGDGPALKVRVDMTASGSYVGGEKDVSEFGEAMKRLGKNWVAVVSPNPPPPDVS
jgi:hypothetical protein